MRKKLEGLVEMGKYENVALVTQRECTDFFMQGDRSAMRIMCFQGCY